jgi:hypothetical protein
VFDRGHARRGSKLKSAVLFVARLFEAFPRKAERLVPQIRELVLALFVSIAGIACGLESAGAQKVPAPGGYQFFFTRHLWLAGIHATTITLLAASPK